MTARPDPVDAIASAFGAWLTDIEQGVAWQEQRRYTRVELPTTMLPLSLEQRRQLGAPTYPHEYPVFYRGGA